MPQSSKTIILTVFLVVPLAACQSTIGPEGIKGSGDSDQDVLQIEGPGSVTSDPETGAWTAACEAPECKLTWITQSQLNAERDVKLVEAAGQLALEAMKEGAIAAAPVP